MTDRWKFHVRSDDAGLPSAIIDVQMTRSFVVPLTRLQVKRSHLLTRWILRSGVL